MSKYIPTKLTQLSANESAAVDVINKNLDSIKEHIDDSLSRSAKSPSQMQADLDMNGKKIINIGRPTNDTDLVRKIDVVESEAAIKQMADAVQAIGAQVVQVAAAAGSSAEEAVDSAALAEAWATKMDGPVDDDKYSSKYYAENIGADVHTVAEIATDVTTVAGKKNEVTTVAGIASDVSTVAGIASDVSAVEDIASDVSTVASNVSDVSTVADDVAKVAAVADDLTNIDSVADDLTNIDAVAGNQANIDAVAGNLTNINTVAGDSTAINSVASDLTNVDAVNANKTNIDTVAENIGDIRDKVSKTGDTMTGELIVEDSPVTIQNTTFDSTTTTAPAQWTALGMFCMFDENGKYTGYVENTFTTGNYVQTTLGARRIVSGESKSASIKAMVDSSGNTRAEMSEAHVASNVKVINSGVTMGTNPGGTQYAALTFVDKTDGATWNQTRLGIIESKVNTDGSTEMNMSTKKFVSGDSSQATIWVKETKGGVASCSFPNTTCVDSAYVESSSTVANGVSLNGSSALSYTLSNLPNDGKKYMVLITGSAQTGTTSGNQVLVQITTTLNPSGVNLCRTHTRTSSAMYTTGSCWIPVSSDRKIYLERSTNYNGTCNLYMKGYRRIGTNS